MLKSMMPISFVWMMAGRVILAGMTSSLVFSMVLASYAQATLLTIKLDKAEYRAGDTIQISGQVEPVVANERVLIQVYGPLNALTRIEPVLVNADGSYTYSYTIGGPLNTRSGEYRTEATYMGITRETSFTFAAGEDGWMTYPLNIGDATYDLRYKSRGGEIDSISANKSLATLLITIKAPSDGMVTMQIPYGLFSSLGLSLYTDWISFVDSIPADVRTSYEQCFSEATIPFESGAEEIEIVGSWLPGGPDPEHEHDVIPSAIIYNSTARFAAEGQAFMLPIRLDALDCRFSFVQTEKRLHADVMGPGGEPGYFEVTIPHRFLGGNYTVLLDGEPLREFEATYNPRVNGLDSTTISFDYDPDRVRAIDIIGTTAIPEIGTTAVVILAISAGTMIAIVRLRYRIF